jgi:tetratricopeptide (TPR) repeat protein
MSARVDDMCGSGGRLTSLSPDLPNQQPLAGQRVVFSGRLSSLRRSDARALVARYGGSTAEDVTPKTTMLVVSDEPPASPDVPAEPDAAVRSTESASAPKSQKLLRAERLNKERPGRIDILTEEQFCRLVGVPTAEELRRQYHAMSDLLARYTCLREDHLSYLVKSGMIHPVVRTNTDTFFAFPDLAVVKQVNDDLSRGASFRAATRSLLASLNGQLILDFRLDAAPARILSLAERSTPAPPQADASSARRDVALGEHYFHVASKLDNGEHPELDAAAAAYRKALEHDPYLIAALINLANIHYGRDELVEAQALYERAIGLEPDFFEAHFNLGNIYHDLGRLSEAQACYGEALRLNPLFPDAHFYLAVTCEKMGLSDEARPHWRAYQQLAPKGEWVELAKEFSD